MDTLLHFDRELFFVLNHGLNHPLLDPVMWLITSLGLGWVQMLIVLVALGTWEWRRRIAARSDHVANLTPLSPLAAHGEERTPAPGSPAPSTERGLRGEVRQSGFKTIFLPALLAFAGSGLTTQAIKRALPRPRPSNLPEAIVAPDERIFHNSFPSGHTTTAFALAFWLFMLTCHTRYRWWGYSALMLAGLVGLSRIYRGVHYPSDVLVGALIGILWGAIAYFTLSAPHVSALRAAELPPDSASASPRD